VARASRRRSWLPAGKFGRVGGGSFQLVSQGAPIKATLLSLERELRIRVSRPSFEGGDFILPSDETEALDINWARDSPVMRTLFPSFAIMTSVCEWAIRPPCSGRSLIVRVRSPGRFAQSRSEQLSVRTHALPQSGSRSSATAPAAPSRVVGGSVRCAAHRGGDGWSHQDRGSVRFLLQRQRVGASWAMRSG